MKDITLFVCVLLLIVAFWGGYINNLVTLYHHSSTMETGQIIIRSVGIPILPVGAIMGYIGE